MAEPEAPKVDALPPVDFRKIADRVRKLLSLSRSSNANEAANAARMAQELMQEHKLAEADVTEETKDGSDLIDVAMGSAGFMATWKFALMTSVARAFFCDTIGLRVGNRRKVRVVGRRDDVAVVGEVFRFVVKEIERLAVEQVVGDLVPPGRSERQRSVWDVYREADHAGDGFVSEASRRDSFRCGAAAGVAETLADQARRWREGSERAMVVSRKSRDEVKQYMEGKFTDQRKIEGEDDVENAPADFLRGLEAGRRIQISVDQKRDDK